MTKETQSSFADDAWDVEQAGTVQNFIAGHEVMPMTTTYMEGIQSFPVSLFKLV